MQWGRCKTSKEVGQAAEDAALNYLLARRLHLIERNFRSRYGEIDLIMRDHDIVVFVEVRYRRDDRFGAGFETVSAGKQARIAKTALSFLDRRPEYQGWPLRFDVVSLCGENKQILWISGAFDYDEF